MMITNCIVAPYKKYSKEAHEMPRLVKRKQLSNLGSSIGLKKVKLSKEYNEDKEIVCFP
jgi:hypothetical protein